MPRITETPRMPAAQRKLRVAAYARVSSGKDAMLHSLAAQVTHYGELIGSNPAWEYAGVYSDEGISGTKERRPGFEAMVSDALSGKIDLILTKAISRFARNVATMLRTVRALKAKGVGVYFEEENLNTLSAEGELFLTLAAAMAEAEARDVSEAMLWRIRRDMAKGLYWGGTCPYGFRVENRGLVQVPEEAEVVRRMFVMYLGGLGDASIAKALNREKIPGRKGGLWEAKTVREVLMNVAHCGDLMLQKTYRPDFLTKKDAKNRGQRDGYYVEGAHEGIVTPEVYRKCMAIRAERAGKAKATGLSKPGSPLSRLIRCPHCGSAMRRKAGNGNPQWRCRLHDRMGPEYCPGSSVSEKALLEALFGATGAETAEEAAGMIEKAVVRGDLLEIATKGGGTVEAKLKRKRRKGDAKREER